MNKKSMSAVNTAVWTNNSELKLLPVSGSAFFAAHGEKSNAVMIRTMSAIDCGERPRGARVGLLRG